MWTTLSDPDLGEYISDLGHEYAPLRELVERLAQQAYAKSLYAVTSLMHLSLTTAPDFEQQTGHDMIGVDYNPRRGLFELSYNEWISSSSNPSRRAVAKLLCEPSEASKIIDVYVVRLLMLCRSNRRAESN